MPKTTKKVSTRPAVSKKSVASRKEASKSTVRPLSIASLLKGKELPKQLQKINLVPVAVLLVAAFILVGGFLFLRKNLIVASINGQPLTRFEVIKLLEKQSGKQTVDSLVSKVLVQQEANRQKIVIEAEKISEEIKKIEDQLKGQGSDLESVLSMQGMTRAELEEQISLRLILERLMADKTKVTEKEVNDYIEANRANFPETLKGAELKKTVREQLAGQKLSTEAQKLLEKLKEAANIKYYLTY
jgi:hypothetical protein